MNTINQLRTYASQMIAENKDLKDQIVELYQLCLDEIEEGESESNEIQNCYSAINDLIK